MKNPNKRAPKLHVLARSIVTLAKRLFPEQCPFSLDQLRELTLAFGFSLTMGELLLLDGKWYVTHSGLLRLALRKHCFGIQTDQLDQFSDPATGRWVFKAIVFKGPSSRGFVGFGDADPSNVSSKVHGAEMRVAETRAVNRALRKAYGIGLCSVEEMGALSNTSTPSVNSPSPNRYGSDSPSGSKTFQPSLRDRLCVLIRQFNLDASLVKSYAADFCDTELLSNASRESVESFIAHLSAAARENRDALICKLNSYAKLVEVNP